MSLLEGKEDITADWREKFLNTYKVSCSKSHYASPRKYDVSWILRFYSSIVLFISHYRLSA